MLMLSRIYGSISLSTKNIYMLSTLPPSELGPTKHKVESSTMSLHLYLLEENGIKVISMFHSPQRKQLGHNLFLDQLLS